MNEQDRINKYEKAMHVEQMLFEPMFFFTEWLIAKGFFTVPASTKYHGAYEGGLFDHSYAVMEILLQLTKDNGLNWESKRSPYLIGMFHDLCKLEAYVQNEDGTYKYNDEQLLPGHGEKSIILLQHWFSLTEEEILCIRWHMGAFDDKENWKYYSKSVAKYPNVLWVHQADMIASQVEGK